MTKPPISAAHERLNQIRRWLKNNPHHFRPTHLVLLWSVTGDIATPEHVETLQSYLRGWQLPPEEAQRQKESTAELIRQAEASRAAWFAERVEAERQGVPDPPYPLPETENRPANPSPHHVPAPTPSTKPTIT